MLRDQVMTPDQVRAELDELFGWSPEEISDGTELRSAGIDSLRLVWLVSHFAETHGIEPNMDGFLALTTVGQLCLALAAGVTTIGP